MKTNTIHCLAAALLLALAPALSSRAESVDDPILGQWEGVVISDASVDLPFGSIALDIGSRQNRLYEGLIGLVPPNPVVPPNPIEPVDPGRLLLSASGQVSLSSHTEEWTLNAQGAFDGSSLSLDYHISFRDGTQDFGVMLVSR